MPEFPPNPSHKEIDEFAQKYGRDEYDRALKASVNELHFARQAVKDAVKMLCKPEFDERPCNCGCAFDRGNQHCQDGCSTSQLRATERIAAELMRRVHDERT